MTWCMTFSSGGGVFWTDILSHNSLSTELYEWNYCIYKHEIEAQNEEGRLPHPQPEGASCTLGITDSTTTCPQNWSWSLLLFVPVAKRTRQQNTFCRGAQTMTAWGESFGQRRQHCTADKAVWVQGRIGEDSPIHLADRTDDVIYEQEKKKKSSMSKNKVVTVGFCLNIITIVYTVVTVNVTSCYQVTVNYFILSKIQVTLCDKERLTKSNNQNKLVLHETDYEWTKGIMGVPFYWDAHLDKMMQSSFRLTLCCIITQRRRNRFSVSGGTENLLLLWQT